ncbi:MAG TPA: hypothetical protein PK668_24085 [Myxococcota bacterium]|nr:hypothetical protein [Myxococcota bacterium]HRY95342.1 hypothetical protein [Myxococcota bacterium]HSA21185.1 hypothetical protein [Myxococcota bacterium]
MSLADALLIGTSGALIGWLAWRLARELLPAPGAHPSMPARAALRRRLVLGLGAWLGLVGLNLGGCQWLSGRSAPPEQTRPRVMHCYHRTLLSPGEGRGLDPRTRERLLAPPTPAPGRGTRPGPHCWLSPRVLDKARAQLLAERARAAGVDQA